MPTTRTIFLFSLELSLLSGLNLWYCFLPLPELLSGMAFGAALGVTIGKGWRLLRQPST